MYTFIVDRFVLLPCAISKKVVKRFPGKCGVSLCLMLYKLQKRIDFTAVKDVQIIDK